MSNNPCGFEDVEFIEYTGSSEAQKNQHFEKLFKSYGFSEIGQRPKSGISLHRQGKVNFIVNYEAGSFAADFAKAHGPSICSMGLRVKDAQAGFQTAVSRGAKAYLGTDEEKGALPFPAIYGIGDSLVYFVDEKSCQKLYQQIFKVSPTQASVPGYGFEVVDHVTNNVPVGEMQKWCDFYSKVFNFRETLYFDIKGKSTGLISKVMRAPAGQFAIPINEPTDPKSQIQEYLNEYKGSGIQHVAMTTPSILKTLGHLKENKNEFLKSPPETYYKMLKDRLPTVTEAVQSLQDNAILADGDHEGYLLQIFSKNIIGPIFFELIQRKGHDGFGNGNFQALFDAIEEDQRERGFLT